MSRRLNDFSETCARCITDRLLVASVVVAGERAEHSQLPDDTGRSVVTMNIQRIRH